MCNETGCVCTHRNGVPVWRVCVLTLDGEDHALADVRAHPVGGLAEVETAVLLQNVSDEQRAVTHDLDPARQRHGVVLLGVPDTRWREKRE